MHDNAKGMAQMQHIDILFRATASQARKMSRLRCATTPILVVVLVLITVLSSSKVDTFCRQKTFLFAAKGKL